MSFTEKYTDDAKEAGKKKLVSTDTMAIGELLEEIAFRLRVKNG